MDQNTVRPAPKMHLKNIQALRGIAALLVVGVHLQANEARASVELILSPWFFMGVSGVDLFFVISGFIMVYISADRHGGISQSAKFLVDRVARVYPPAMLFTAVTILGMFVAGTADKWLPMNNVIWSFLLLPQKAPPLLGVAWTLIHEMYFYVIFAGILWFRARWLPAFLVLWAGIVFAGWYDRDIWLENPYTKIIFHPLTFEFIIGAFVGLAAVHFKPKWGWAFLPLGAVLFAWGAISLGPPDVNTFPHGWLRVFSFAPGAALMIWGAFGLEAQNQWTAPKWLWLIGDWSYSLYLSHMLVLATLAHIWIRFASPGMLDNLVYIIVSIVAVLSFSALAFYGFERPILRWLKSKLHPKTG